MFSSQNNKNQEKEQTLFRKQDGSAWIIIVRESSGKIKGYLEVGASRKVLFLKGLPSYLPLENINRAKALFKEYQFATTDYTIEVMPRLRGGMRKNNEQKQAPNEYCCPITLDIMEDPCINEHGHTYERKILEQLLREGKPDPLTKKPFKQINANFNVKKLIQDWNNKNLEVVKPGLPYMDTVDLETAQDYLLLANNFEKREKFLEAEKNYKKALKYTDDAATYNQYANFLAKTGNIKKAYQAFYELGQLHFKSNRFEEAKVSYEKAQELNSKEPNVFKGLIRVHQALNEHSAVLKNLESLASLHASASNLSEAFETYEEVYKLSSDKRYIEKLVELCDRLGNTQGAFNYTLRTYQLKLKDNPDDVVAMRAYKRFLKSHGSLDKLAEVKISYSKKLEELSMLRKDLLKKESLKVQNMASDEKAELEQKLAQAESKYASLEKAFEALKAKSAGIYEPKISNPFSLKFSTPSLLTKPILSPATNALPFIFTPPAEEFIDVFTVDQDGNTKLHLAASNGDMDRIKLLLDRRADIKAVNKNGEAALHLVASSGHIEAMKLLLDRGADVNAVTTSKSKNSFSVFKSFSRSIDNESEMNTALHLSASKRHSEAVKLLLDRGADTKALNKYGRTALHEAAFEGNSEIIRLLLEKGADINAATKNGCTSLHLAAYKGHIEVVTLLLDLGVNVNNTVVASGVIFSPFTGGSTALHLVASNGYNQIVKLLLDRRAHINVTDEYGHTVLHKAVCNRNNEAMKLLLDRGADAKAANKNGETVLHLAASGGYIDAMRLLLDREADVNATTKNGETALHLAAARGHTEAIKLLLDQGIDVNAVTASSLVLSTFTGGCTALHLAISNGKNEVIKLLLDRGADVNATDKDGHTVLHKAVFNENIETTKLLLDRGADVNATAKDNHTALQEAASRGYIETMRLLLDRGADVNATDKDGHTELHLAASKGSVEKVKVLLEKGADIDAENKYGETALHLATSNGYSEIVIMLLDKGADINSTTASKSKGAYFSRDNKNESNTALHLAAAKGYSEIIRLLLSRGADIKATSEQGNTALHKVVCDGHKKATQLPQNRLRRFNKTNKNSDSVLHEATVNERNEIIKLLLDQGVDIDAENKYGETALHLAVSNGNNIFVKLLLERGANINVTLWDIKSLAFRRRDMYKVALCDTTGKMLIQNMI